MTKQPPSVSTLLFSEAQGAMFTTPLWHWTLTWRENRYLNVPARILVGAMAKGLAVPIRLPHGFSLAAGWTWMPLSDSDEATQRIRWSKAFPNHAPRPLEWLDLAKGFDEPFALRMHCNPGGSLSFCLLLTADAEPLAYAAREVNLARGEIEHSYFVVASGKKGGGIATRVMRNAVDFYKKIQITKIFLTAGLSAGGAVWAKFGFRPIDSKAWHDIKVKIIENARKANSAVQQSFKTHKGIDLNSCVNQIIDSTDPRRIWDLVDIDFDGNIAKESQLNKSGLAGLLLQETRWRGILDLEDSEASDRIRLYLAQKLHSN